MLQAAERCYRWPWFSKNKKQLLAGRCPAQLLWAGVNLTSLWQSCSLKWLSPAPCKWGYFISMEGRTGSGSSRVLALRTAYQLLLWSCCYSFLQKRTLEGDGGSQPQVLLVLVLAHLAGDGFFHLSSNQGLWSLSSAPTCSSFSCSSCNRKAVLSLPVQTNWKTLGDRTSCWAASGPPSPPEGHFL